MKLSKAGQVLKGPFFPNKRSEGASFCLATHPRQQRTPFLTSHAEGKTKKKKRRERSCGKLSEAAAENRQSGAFHFYIFVTQFEPFRRLPAVLSLSYLP